MPESWVSITSARKLSPTERRAVYAALTDSCQTNTNDLHPDLAFVDIACPDDDVPHFLESLIFFDEDVFDLIRIGASEILPHRPPRRDPGLSGCQTPNTPAPATRLLDKLQWLVAPRDRADVVHDLRLDAKEMHLSGCSQPFILLCLLWHLLICLTQYVRSSLSPKRFPRDPS